MTINSGWIVILTVSKAFEISSVSFRPRTVPINSKRGTFIALSGATLVFAVARTLELSPFRTQFCDVQQRHRHLERPTAFEEKWR